MSFVISLVLIDTIAILWIIRTVIELRRLFDMQADINEHLRKSIKHWQQSDR